MSNKDLQTLLASITVLSFIFWWLNGWRVRVAGIWQKEVEENKQPERIRLSQTGPFIQGKRIVPGGIQVFSGHIFGNTLHLKRKDEGIDQLVNAGFPLKIAPLVEGKHAGSLKLHLTDEGASLVGEFEPIKFTFTVQPPRITGIKIMPQKSVRYTRLQGIIEEEESHLTLPQLLSSAESAQSTSTQQGAKSQSAALPPHKCILAPKQQSP